MDNLILVINGGSSSIKLSAFAMKQEADPLLWSSNISCNLLDASDDEIKSQLAEQLKKQNVSLESVKCVGHRIVHGGEKLRDIVAVDDGVEKEIEALTELAPVHNPIGLKLVKQARVLLSDAKHFAVFDTAFHKSMDEPCFVYPLPYDWYEELGIRRFGFHGINHQFCAEAALNFNKSARKIVIAHLGNGCSLSAVSDGKSVDTSMGFTPNEGLMMGARSGSIDPGIIFYLLREKNFPVEDLEAQLNNKSGLSGVSGIGKDMREIQTAMETGNKRARLAFNIFVHRIKSGIASMAATMNGIDTLIFTAGIGEHSAAVRSEVCKGLTFLGIDLDPQLNYKCTVDGIISSTESSIKVLRITAREDLQIFRQCLQLS